MKIYNYAIDAEKAIEYIQKIYFYENRLREQNLNDEEFIAERKKKILPILNEFHDWMIKIQPTVIPERSIKPFVLGRKNWLFAGSEDGARSSCLLFSLIECAKIQGINPEDYLRCIFEQAIDTETWTEDDWKKLLPWNIKITSFEPKCSWISPQRVEN